MVILSIKSSSGGFCTYDLLHGDLAHTIYFMMVGGGKIIWVGRSIFEVVFIFEVTFILDVVFIFEVIFIFEVVFTFYVIFIFEVVFIFELIFFLILRKFVLPSKIAVNWPLLRIFSIFHHMITDEPLQLYIGQECGTMSPKRRGHN